MRYYLAVFLAVFGLGAPWYALTYPDQFRNFLISVSDTSDQVALVILSHNPKTVEQIKSKYLASNTSTPSRKVSILIVPGHEANYGGAEFGSLKERDLNIQLANNLQKLLQSNEHFQVFVTRSEKSWNPVFDTYFATGWQDIVTWTKAHHEEMTQLISVGSIKPVVPTVIHNKAPTDVAYRLFGMTKWANENDVDIIIHIHFNDNPGHGPNTPGKYSGIAIYVPEKQYYNSTTTLAVAESVFKRLSRFNPVSDLPGESTGIVEEPDLIAIGAYNTSDAASMLIEYGYIYEPQFVKDDLRKASIVDLAFQTYLGLQDFFDKNMVVSKSLSYDTLLLPYEWRDTSSMTTGSSSEIYALQTAFVVDGVYPPKDKKMNDCPRTGSFGPCTMKALEEFQNKYDITGEKGIVGPKTRSVLNSKFGISLVI
ncbi:MAG: N-acetylmuramoyl-L-alanine amidase [Candidatus Taylorbacteria bacterium]